MLGEWPDLIMIYFEPNVIVFFSFHTNMGVLSLLPFESFKICSVFKKKRNDVELRREFFVYT